MIRLVKEVTNGGEDPGYYLLIPAETNEEIVTQWTAEPVSKRKLGQLRSQIDEEATDGDQ